MSDVWTAPGQAAVTTSTSYCYDWADRLLSSAVTGAVPGATTVADGLAASEITYDVRGNTKRLGDMQFSYDAANRHIGTTYDDGTTVAIVRDASGRIVSRTMDPAGSAPAVTTKYLYAGGVDAAWGQKVGSDLTRRAGHSSRRSRGVGRMTPRRLRRGIRYARNRRNWRLGGLPPGSD